MPGEKNAKPNQAYDVSFKWAYVHPRYWLTWIGVGFLGLLAFVPHRPRDWFGALIGRWLSQQKFIDKRRKIARVNLSLCFPDLSLEDQNKIIEQNVVSLCQTVLAFGELSVRSAQFNRNRFVVHGEEHLKPILDSGKPAVLMVPHTYCVDFAGLYWSSLGYDFTTMFNTSKNGVLDWLMARQRLRYGGYVFHRSAGLKALIGSMRMNYSCYYLPDQDHGPERSVFAPLFSAQKATLPVLGKMAQRGGAEVVPIYVAYNAVIGKFEMFLRPAMQDFPTGSPEQDARRMNEEIEYLLSNNLAQYMWILKIFKTQPEGQPDPYK